MDIYRRIKALLDFVLSLLLIIITFPIWLIISFVIYTEDKGPIFFTQDRVGKNGKIFKIIKFRTMHCHANPYMVSSANDDGRHITPCGSILRNRGLDELPNLLNVLQGHISLVGPRPEMRFVVESYNNLQKKRLLVKPGLTGLWQVLAPKDEPIHHHLKYDLYYIKRRTLRLDLWILIKTAAILVCGKKTGMKKKKQSYTQSVFPDFIMERR